MDTISWYQALGALTFLPIAILLFSYTIVLWLTKWWDSK